MGLIWPEIENEDFMRPKMLSKNLSLAEVLTSQTAIRRGIRNVPSAQAIANLEYIAEHVFQKIRDHFGVPIRVSSGYRSPELNVAVGGSHRSQHTTGQALDLQGTNGVTNAEIFEYIKDHLDFDQLIWEYGDQQEPAWVHVSYRYQNNRKQVFAVGVDKNF